MDKFTITEGIVVMSVQDELWESQKEFVRQYKQSIADLIAEDIPVEKAKEIVDRAVAKNAEEIEDTYERCGARRIAENVMATAKALTDKLFGGAPKTKE